MTHAKEMTLMKIVIFFIILIFIVYIIRTLMDTPKDKLAQLSSGDDDEANMDIDLPEETVDQSHGELNFRDLERTLYEPSTDDLLDEWDEDNFENQDWEE